MATIRIDQKEFRKLETFLTRLERRQIPFATSGAMNDTMFGARQHIVEVTWPQSVTVRNKRFMGVAMRVAKASKRKLVSEIFDRLGRGLLGWQAEGGTRPPAVGAGIAIPTTFTRQKRSKTTGRMPKAWQPRNPKFTYKREDQLVRQESQRINRTVYVVKPSVNIKKRFRFYETVPDIIGRRFGKDFAKRFERAVASAIVR